MKQKLLSFIFVLTCLIGVSHAQNRQVSGKVTSASDGTPVSGVSVAVVGTTTATQTDATGNYTLSIPSGSQTLSFSYVGYATQRLPLGTQSVLNVQLQPDETSLEEIVVTAMGIERSAKSLTYATSRVNPDDLLQNSEPDVLKAMQGKVAGVDIRTSQGTPGAATRFQVRGNTSFFGDNQPLIIVDGVPYDNSMTTTSSMTSGGGAYGSGISNLDPNDIESMNVLKGSAAAALYGSRASNGAVIITTKSGAAKLDRPTSVTLRSSFSLENVANLPKYQNSYGAGSQFNYSNSNGSWGPKFGSRDSIPTWPDYLAAYPDMFGANVPYRAYPNNVRDLFETGRVWENSVNFAGGGEKSGFNVTLSQMDHKGYVPNSSFKRYNLSAGGNLKVSDKMNVRGNIAFTNSNQVGGYFGENQVDGAASSFARSLFLGRNWDGSLPYETLTGRNLNWLGGGQFDHPTWSAFNNYATTLENRVLTSFAADYAINDWWKLDYNLGANLSFLDRKEIYEISSRAYEGLGGLVTDQRNHRELESTFRTTFTPKISEDFSFRGILGFNYNQRVTDRMTNEGKRFISPGIYTLTNNAQQLFITDDMLKRRIMGLFADAEVGFRDYLYLNVTARNDWSSTLPQFSRSYFYPGVSTSFVFTDAFKLESNILSYGKIRGAWARVGRDTDPYNLQNLYGISTNFLGQPNGALSIRSNNPNLTPEFTQEFEVGTELAFFNRRVNLDLSYYNRISTDLLAPISVPVSSGYDEYFTNFGKIRNRGVEASLQLKPLATSSPVQWTLSAAFTRNKNTVEELIDGTERIQLRGILSGTISAYLEPGLPFGYLRGTRSLRDDEGNLLINPATGAMIEDQSQEYNLGDPNPDFKLGINNVVTYKGFSFQALFDWTKGGKMYSVTNSSLLGRGVTMDTENRELNAILPGVYGDPLTGQAILDANGNKIANQTKLTVNDLYFSPEATLGQTFAINTATEWNIYDATVYRLREVSIAYDIPRSALGNSFFKGLTVSLTGRNLWHFAPNFPKYSNFDPEVNSYGSTSTQGIDLSAAPTTRRYGLNLVARF
ncbi:SusC/RagA family TonB-linked outer membrane protein [Sphingobacterium griseoflavum]|uniref:SusC/RagA family TonB-linked outer membrane protein n=1 Tax=Sphingobacterium griseoflavum TaxID=1474952 RepID=A0ABQ3HXJ0_9SPHI|nr:SusC/RagA family TonB-linked outer membrane protein [Sphingobacterium griseoflavum]GHE37487.1 SusC/RagA family TonB-linked outer membrane protein [Sphingobacterium griseoflavum]